MIKNDLRVGGKWDKILVLCQCGSVVCFKQGISCKTSKRRTSAMKRMQRGERSSPARSGCGSYRKLSENKGERQDVVLAEGS